MDTNNMKKHAFVYEHKHHSKTYNLNVVVAYQGRNLDSIELVEVKRGCIDVMPIIDDNILDAIAEAARDEVANYLCDCGITPSFSLNPNL
jgi:hypothetical protein